MDQVDDRFVRSVVELVGQVLEGKQEPGSATSRIRQAFLDQNPTTADNVESIGLIRLGATTASDGSPAVGLKVGKENLSLSHIFWKAVESDQVAELIREAALEGVRDELPHSITVAIEEMGLRADRPEDKPLLDIQPAKKSDKPKAEPATA